MFRHAIRLGTHAEKDYLLRGSPFFTEVVVNANLLEATAGATAFFLISLAKPYVIDPITYSFGQDPYYLMNTARGDLKRTFRALSERFGDPVLACLNSGRPVRPDDFSHPSTIQGFSERVIRYLSNRLGEALVANEAFLEPVQQEVPPARLIAPYFFNDATLAWLHVNRDLAEASLYAAPDPHQLWVAISFDSLLLDRREEIERLVEAYEPLPCGGFLLWPSDFDETRATAGQITGLRWLVQSLCTRARSATMMYGGYFSALLSDEGMAGTSHGVGYGEKRDIVPVVGGGIPPAKYYLPPIHDRIDISEILQLSRQMDPATFRTDVCDCTICAGLISRGGLQLWRSEFAATEDKPYGRKFRSVPTPRVYRLTRFHYIENKHRELSQIGQTTRDSLLDSLTAAYETFSRYLGSGRLGYLHRWRQGLLQPLD
jgi:hypothetical protein